MNGGVYNAERWNPATGQWTTLAAQAVTRQYHSTALLLPDGRVLSSGGGICSTCDQVDYLAKNAEVFTPPYLFKKDGSGQLAPRPEITGAPGTVSHGTSFQITTPNAASIQKVGLMRLGSQTHSVEMEQRYLPLNFTAGNGTLTASVPANVHTGVPGVYMLFIVDSAGVPSVAKMVNLDSAAPPAPPSNRSPTAPRALADTTAPALRARVKRRQRVLRQRGAVAYVRCSEACSVAARGRLRIGRLSFAMRPASRAALSGRRVRLKAGLTRSGRRALRRALRRERRASVRLTLRAVDAAGNRSPTVRRRVRALR
jgi:galactose oxidase-like protein